VDFTFSEALLATVSVFGFFVLAAVLVALYLASYRRILNVWARRNGYTIIHSELRHLLTGPFFLRAVNSQHVYRVTVQDRDGAIQKGWVRCGGFWLGPFSDAADVRWDRDRRIPQPDSVPQA
jgi:hypothetical protein